MEFAALFEHAARLGPILYLATWPPPDRPHVVPVHIDWQKGTTSCRARTTDARIRSVAFIRAVCRHSSEPEQAGSD